MKNFIQAGNTVTIPAPDDVASGDFVIVGELRGVVAGTVDSGEAMDLATVGVFELPAVAADTFTVGAAVYWDSTAKLATKTASGNTKIGAATVAKIATAGTVAVRLFL